MKEWLKSFSREQLTFAACAGFAVLFLLMGIVGGAPEQKGPAGLPATGSREYSYRPSLQLRFLEPDFEKTYWVGKDVFQTESASLLPIPQILAPLPRPETPVVPLFRPTPPLDIYNKTAKVKYPALLPKALVTDADLLAAADLDALKAIEEVAPPAWTDKGQDRERENCEWFMLAGDPHLGRCSPEGPGCGLNEDAPAGQMIKIKSAKLNSVVSFKKGEQVKSMTHAWKNIDQYDYRSKHVKTNEAEERYKLGLWCYDRGMLAQAKQELQRSVELRHEKAILLLGQIHEEEGNFDAAVAHYAASESPANRDELRWRAGECLRKLGLHEAALAMFEKTTSTTRFFRGKVSYAWMQFETGKGAAAIPDITGYFQKFGNDAQFPDDVRILAYYVRGRCWLDQGEYAKAIADFEAAGKYRNKPVGSAGICAQALTALGACHAFEGRWKDAAAAFQAAILEDQYAIEAWVDLAGVYILAGKLAEAEELLKRAAVRDPSTADALAATALGQILAEKYDDAKKSVDAALKVDPGHVYSNYLRGELGVRSGDLTAAVDASRAALRAQPLFLPAYYATATACLRNAERDLSDADRLDATIEQNSKSLAVLGKMWSDVARDQYGLIPESYRAGARENLTRAEILYRQLADLDANRINLQIALGCTYALLADAENAKARFNTAKGLVNQANLKQDPIAEYGLGYVQYRYGKEDSVTRLDNSLPMFRDAAGSKDYKDPMSTFYIKEAGEVLKRIQEWRVTSLLLDENFNRKDSDRVSAGGTGTWIERDTGGRVPIRIVDNKCVLGGTPGTNWILSRLERDQIPCDRFSRLDVTFLPEPQTTSTFEFGVSIYAPMITGANSRQGLHFGFDRQRNLRIGNRAEAEFENDRQEMSDTHWSKVQMKWTVPQEIRLRIERRKQDQSSVVELSIWNPATKAYEKLGGPQALQVMQGMKGDLKISFWVRGWTEKLTLAVDDVKIYEKRER